MQEQHVAQEMMQEQQRAADKRRRQFMSVILERRAYKTPTATRYTIEKSSPINRLREFYGELEDWTPWSRVHRAQLSALACADAVTETVGDETKLNRVDFDRGSADPDQLHKVR